jgi:hypothetical protein
MVDPHTIATFAFAQMRRDPEFGPRFPWIRNTIVCVESDLADDVLMGQMLNHFPEGGTVACYYPSDHRMMFIWVDKPETAKEHDPKTAHPRTIQARDVNRDLTIGMLVDTMYRDRGGNWSHLPVFGIGQASTAEVEKQLALT